MKLEEIISSEVEVYLLIPIGGSLILLISWFHIESGVTTGWELFGPGEKLLSLSNVALGM